MLSSTTTWPHNHGVPNPPFGEPTTPAWATFGAYTPSTQLDHFGGLRDVGPRRDVGADER